VGTATRLHYKTTFELIEEGRYMPQRMFKLNTCTMAILDENNQPSVVSIPANAVITLVVEDPDGNGFVKVRYGEKTLSMFAVDLCRRGERMARQSA